jgi:hydrogenase nickel incorporation protein HypA/HybF
MHEVSLAGGILQVVENALRHEPDTRLKRLTLEVGALAGVETRALDFALRTLASGTVLEGAEIVLDEVPGQAWCLQCSQTVPILSRLDPCPRCASHWVQPTGGTELKVRDLIVVDSVLSPKE